MIEYDMRHATRILERSLAEAIHQYKAEHGEAPRCIFAKHGALNILRGSAGFYFHPGMVAEFQGIPLALVQGDGFEIYLVGDPIEIREHRPDEHPIRMPEARS